MVGRVSAICYRMLGDATWNSRGINSAKPKLNESGDLTLTNSRVVSGGSHDPRLTRCAEARAETGASRRDFHHRFLLRRRSPGASARERVRPRGSCWRHKPGARRRHTDGDGPGHVPAGTLELIPIDWSQTSCIAG